MSDVLAAAAVEDRAWLVRQGRELAAERTGARFLWPDAADGEGVPCSLDGIQKAERLSPDGGGISTFDTCIVTVDTAYFPESLPVALEGCKVKTRPSHAWRHMKIVSVNEPPGEGVILLELNSYHEGA